MKRKTINNIGVVILLALLILPSFTIPLFAAQSESIIISVSVDNLPPINPSLNIAEGDYTNQTIVHLNLSAEGASYMMISEDETFTGTFWEDYTIEKTWSFATDKEEEKTIYAKFKSSYGGISSTVSDSIILDRTPPDFVITFPPDGSYIDKDGNAH